MLEWLRNYRINRLKVHLASVESEIKAYEYAKGITQVAYVNQERLMAREKGRLVELIRQLEAKNV